METPQASHIEEVETLFKNAFPNADLRIYLHDDWAIRIKIIDPQFKGLSRIQRDELAFPLIEKLPPEVAATVTMLLLRAPGDQPKLSDLEFDDPTPTFADS